MNWQPLGVDPSVQELFRRNLGPAIKDEPQPTAGVVDCKPAASKKTAFRIPGKVGLRNQRSHVDIDKPPGQDELFWVEIR